MALQELVKQAATRTRPRSVEAVLCRPDQANIAQLLLIQQMLKAFMSGNRGLRQRVRARPHHESQAVEASFP
ncbi:hypothetical protein D3M96_05390 [Alcaligenes aquatilis]|uniref:Uncharacterized protein n=1 Tax=Alcaligenes aquatilis TaxID=323284 RepID=A0A3G2HSN8_9BURK|nr:hypothetical protein D3M96_05390 [Alcaligenes aquatilis]